MNILIDLANDLVDHLRDVQRVYGLASRRAAISHIIRQDMLRSPCGKIAREMDKLAGVDAGSGPVSVENWPVHVEKIICPKCDPVLAKVGGGVIEHCGGIDETRADLDNRRRGVGNERMIRWICVCPKCLTETVRQELDGLTVAMVKEAADAQV